MCIKSLPKNAFAIFSKIAPRQNKKNEKSRVERCAFEKYFNFTSRDDESKTRPVSD